MMAPLLLGLLALAGGYVLGSMRRLHIAMKALSDLKGHIGSEHFDARLEEIQKFIFKF